MSEKREKPNFSDAKLLEYESSDSGFLSGGNLCLSGEVPPEDPPSEAEAEEAPKGDAEEDMKLDSGVDLILTDSFSGLSLKNPDLNDLSCSAAKTRPKREPAPPVEQPPRARDLPWKECFQQDEDGDTFLHIAILQGFVEMVLRLIRIAPHPFLFDTPNDHAQTPIHLAAATGQWQVVRWLIVAGAKPSARNVNGDSPLHIAARNGDLQCCKAITDPVQEQERERLALNYPQQPYPQLNLDQWNYEGQTAVHVAAVSGHVDVLRHLVWYGADINAKEGRGGYTALHYAMERGDERLATFLLTECKKLDPEAVTYGGRSALQLEGRQVPSSISRALRSRGVPSPYSSDDEFSDSESEHEMYESASMYNVPNLVNASA